MIIFYYFKNRYFTQVQQKINLNPIKFQQIFKQKKFNLRD